MQQSVGAAPQIESDQMLIAAARANDRQAFGRLVQRYERPVRAVCWAVLRDHHRAADAAQDAFVEAFRGLHGLRDCNAFAGWIMTIARNRAIRHRRLHRSAPALPPGLPAPPVRTHEPDADLLRAIAALPEPLRAVVMLRYFDSNDVAAVATILSRPIGTVTKQLSRAHDRLRRHHLAKEKR